MGGGVAERFFFFTWSSAPAFLKPFFLLDQTTKHIHTPTTALCRTPSGTEGRHAAPARGLLGEFFELQKRRENEREIGPRQAKQGKKTTPPPILEIAALLFNSSPAELSLASFLFSCSSSVMTRATAFRAHREQENRSKAGAFPVFLEELAVFLVGGEKKPSPLFFSSFHGGRSRLAPERAAKKLTSSFFSLDLGQPLPPQFYRELPPADITDDYLWSRLEPLLSYLTVAERAKVREALNLAFDSHAGQARKSGEPFVTHGLLRGDRGVVWARGQEDCRGRDQV